MCPYSPLLHLNLNAVMCEINSINSSMWGASRKHSWLVMQIKELRGFYCPTHFDRTLLFFPHLNSPAGYSPAVERAGRALARDMLQPWAWILVQWPSKIKGDGNDKVQVSVSQHQSCCGPRSHWETVPHLKMPIFLCYIAHLFIVLNLFRISFGLTRRICFFMEWCLRLLHPNKWTSIDWAGELIFTRWRP